MWYICLSQLKAIWYEYGRYVSVLNACSNVLVLQGKKIHRDWRPLDQRLVVRRRPFGTPLTTCPLMPTSTLSRSRSIRDQNTGLQLSFQSRMRGNFPTTSISVGSRSINGFRGVWDNIFMLAAPTYHRKPLPRKLDFHRFPADRWVFEGNGSRIWVPHPSKLPQNPFHCNPSPPFT